MMMMMILVDKNVIVTMFFIVTDQIDYLVRQRRHCFILRWRVWWREEDIVDDYVVVIHELFDSWRHGQLSHGLFAIFHQRPRMHRLRQPNACVLVVWRYHNQNVCWPYRKQSEKCRQRCTIKHDTINSANSGREQLPPRRQYRRRISIDQTHIPTQQQQQSHVQQLR